MLAEEKDIFYSEDFIIFRIFYADFDDHLNDDVADLAPSLDK